MSRSRIRRRGALDLTQEMDRFLAEVEKRAFGMARMAIADRDEALDIVQDAMERFVRRYGRRPAEEWRPLFFRILTNRVRDWHRRRSVRNRFTGWLRTGPDEDADPFMAVPGAPADRPDRTLEVGEAMAGLTDAVQALPARQQQAFMLRCLEGLGTADTAAAMGCSEGSVKTHYSRAIHTLRDKLGEHWHD